MLTYLTSGESHGPQLTAVIDGLPAGLKINVEAVNHQLARRQKGYGRGGRMRIEKDQIELVAGVRSGITMGGPVTIVVQNRDWKNWSQIMDPVKPIGEELTDKQHKLAYDTHRPRPGHADLAGGIKWHHHDMRNVLERSSARETAARVALGAVARQLLEHFNVKFGSHVVGIGEVTLPPDFERPGLEKMAELTEDSDVRCIDADTEQRMIAAIKAALRDKDSIGGVVEIVVQGLPVGLGGFSQWYHRLDGRLAGAMMAIHSVKGVEIGLGFRAAETRGSEMHDQIFFDPFGDPARKKFHRETNNAGGLEGGITNGEDVVVRVAAKPISTLNRPLKTVDVVTKEAGEAIVERTDSCIVPALAVVTEAVAALVLAEAFCEKFGADNLAETERNYHSFLATEY
ncbi:MAG: chorismate synthase [candidate division Zixibacteria bacterium]|nr:chorismate synthase [candidate division Zixibacteria bacterium]MDH3935713.1 chorismate synthase [candidate division Zixibacteria bacterium]MDH4033833.1 chorismate synthase [candidate division Zixibacteria bacterium]